MRDRKQGFHRFGGFRIIGKPTDKLPIDLEYADRRPTQIGQRREAGAEVVENEANTEISEHGDLGPIMLAVLP